MSRHRREKLGNDEFILSPTCMSCLPIFETQHFDLYLEIYTSHSFNLLLNVSNKTQYVFGGRVVDV